MSIIVLTFPGNNLRPSNQRHNGKTSLRYGGIENQIRRISISKTKIPASIGIVTAKAAHNSVKPPRPYPTGKESQKRRRF